jgi:hypothetical protein
MHTGWRRVMLYADAMASFWREWVIDYDASHQQTLAEGAQRSSRQLFYEIRKWGRRQYQGWLADAHRMQETVADSPGRWSIAAGLTTALLLLLINARRLWRALRRRRMAAHPEKSPRQAATIWYERMVRLLARRGWRKSPAQTPGEYVISIEDAALREGVARFTRHYEHARFGESAEDAQRLPEVYEEISNRR